MVADQQGDTVTALDADRQQAVRHRIGGVVELLERQLTFVVDDGRAIRIATCVERGDHAELAPANDVGNHGRDVLRGFDLEGARLEHLPGVVQFGRAALQILLNLGRCLEGEFSEVGHRPTICDGCRMRSGVPAIVLADPLAWVDN